MTPGIEIDMEIDAEVSTPTITVKAVHEIECSIDRTIVAPATVVDVTIELDPSLNP